MTISVWGKYQGKAEVIDRASSKREAERLAREYRMAFGRDWEVWAGRRDRSEFEVGRGTIDRNKFKYA